MPTDTPINWDKSSDNPDGTAEDSSKKATGSEVAEASPKEEVNRFIDDCSLVAQRLSQDKIYLNTHGDKQL